MLSVLLILVTHADLMMLALISWRSGNIIRYVSLIIVYDLLCKLVLILILWIKRFLLLIWNLIWVILLVRLYLLVLDLVEWVDLVEWLKLVYKSLF